MDILYENGYDQMGKDGRIHLGKAKQTKGYQHDRTTPQSTSGKDYYNRKDQRNIEQNNIRQNNRSQQNSQHFYGNNIQEPRWRNNQATEYQCHAQQESCKLCSLHNRSLF